MQKTSGILVSLVAILGLAVLALAAASGPPPAEGDTVIFNKSFAVFKADGKEPVGAYSLKAVSRKADGRIEITESFSAAYRDQKAEFTSTVLYTGGPAPSPVSGTVETRIGGKVSMKGTVAVTEKTVAWECTGFLDKRTGEALNPPQAFPKKEEPRPEGTLVFQSAAAVIGPLLQPKEGEAPRIVFVEFPDDLGAPELINMKKDYRLVRSKPDEKGQFDMQILEPMGDKPIFQFRLDKESRLVAVPVYGKWRLVEP